MAARLVLLYADYFGAHVLIVFLDAVHDANVGFSPSASLIVWLPKMMLAFVLALPHLSGNKACMMCRVINGCYLVDPASSHMLVSKIKPCMCKYELIQTVKLRMAH